MLRNNPITIVLDRRVRNCFFYPGLQHNSETLWRGMDLFQWISRHISVWTSLAIFHIIFIDWFNQIRLIEFVKPVTIPFSFLMPVGKFVSYTNHLEEIKYSNPNDYRRPYFFILRSSLGVWLADIRSNVQSCCLPVSRVVFRFKLCRKWMSEVPK